MLRVSKMADYATMLMVIFARSPDSQFAAKELAADSKLQAPSVSKLLKALSVAGLLSSTRGAHGGYRLAREANTISLLDIINAVEGENGLTECSDDHGDCSFSACCSVSGHWKAISRAINEALATVNLIDMAMPLVREQLIDVSSIERLRVKEMGGS